MDADAVAMMRSLYAYNHWVNQRLLARVDEVPPERLQESFGGSFDTIHRTVAHILQGELFYASCWMQTERRPSPADRTMAEIRAMWDEHQARLDAFLRDLTPAQLGSTVTYTRGGVTWQSPVWQLMHNLINHGTHHRAELADMLTRVGHAPPPLDLADFYQEQARGTEGG